MSDKIILRGNSTLLKPIITEILALNQILRNKDLGTVYTLPSRTPVVPRRGRPKFQLCFLQDTNANSRRTRDNIEQGRKRQEAEISFRLMNETNRTISRGELTNLGNRVKEIFGANGGFVWRKGKTMYSYTDWDLGYQLQLLCRSKTEAKRIVEAVLRIRNHVPNWMFFNVVENDNEAARYPADPPNEIIMGESRKPEIERPLVDVRFQYALVHLGGFKEPIEVCDRSGKLIDPLVRV